MLHPAEAEAAIREHAPTLATEAVSLIHAVGRVLRQPVKLTRDQPPYDRVTMDGIALASASWFDGTRGFRVAATQAAGAAPLSLASPKHCIEVMTGAVLPAGCDCVIPVEKIMLLEGTATLNPGIEPAAWLNVHRRGIDGRLDAPALQEGVILKPAEVAVAASCGLPTLNVSCEPRIVVISTGDELIEPGQEVEDWQIWRSNSYAVLAALKQRGFSRLEHDHLPDNLEVLRTRLQTHLENQDVLILSGGVSMGRFDFIPQVLGELGVKVIFHHIAQRPGKPMWFGVHPTGKAVYALPGNPVSTAVCLRRYVLPGLYAAMGAAISHETTALGASRKALPTLTSFVPIRLMTDELGQTRADPRSTQGSGDFLSLLGTDGFVELPAQEGVVESGAVVPLYRW